MSGEQERKRRGQEEEKAEESEGRCQRRSDKYTGLTAMKGNVNCNVNKGSFHYQVRSLHTSKHPSITPLHRHFRISLVKKKTDKKSYNE